MCKGLRSVAEITSRDVLYAELDAYEKVSRKIHDKAHSRIVLWM